MGSNARAAQSLLDICRNTHDACAKDRGDDAGRLPLLLMDIGLTASDTARLVRRDEACDAAGPAHVRWATVSYPRDPNTPGLGSKKDILDHKESIDLDALPAAYREMAKIARCLGLRYLWIDKFCAWEEEDEECGRDGSRLTQHGTENVADIFEYAEVNIAVPDAPVPVHNGYLGPGKAKLPPARSSRYSPDGLPMIMSLSHFIQPLLSDPWAFQERLLSRRKMYYLDTGDFIWSCRHSHHICSHSSFGKVWADCVMAMPRKWSEVLEAFSRCDVEDEHDQMEAIKGLVQRREAKPRAPWRWNAQIGKIPQDLIWLGDVTYQREEDVSRFWSCSWASWFGPKKFLNSTRATKLAKDFEADGPKPGGLIIQCARHDGPRVRLRCRKSWDATAEACFEAMPRATFVAAVWAKADWQFSRLCYLYDERRKRLLGRGVVDNADHFRQYCADRPAQLALALLVDEAVAVDAAGARFLPWATTAPASSSSRAGDRLLRVHYGLVLLAIGPDEYERVGVFECYGEAPGNVGKKRICLA